jgi:hypothetical protein
MLHGIKKLILKIGKYFQKTNQISRIHTTKNKKFSISFSQKRTNLLNWRWLVLSSRNYLELYKVVARVHNCGLTGASMLWVFIFLD